MNMNNTPIKRWLKCLLLAPVAVVQAQTDAQNLDVGEDVYVLSPFEVTSESSIGYLATATLAGTRIRTDMKDVGSAISVITQEFIRDVGATDSSTLLQYTTNAEVAGTRGTYAGLGNGSSVSELGQLRAPAGSQRVRGLAAADNTRDFFVTDIPWDSYNVERIDIQRGPNSILFGLGSPAGIVNATMRDAQYDNRNSIEVRTGSYGSARGSIDLNRELIDGTFAVRVNALWDHELFQQKQAYEDDDRFYIAARWDPKIFGPDFKTTVRVKYENGNIKANRPRIVPPSDSITPWFSPVDNSSLSGGLNKYAVTDVYALGVTPGSIDQSYYWLNGVMGQQNPMWFIDGATGSTYQINSGYINTGARNADGTIRGSGDNLVGQRWSSGFYVLRSANEFANSVKLPFSEFGQYKVQSLTDDSIYNFYENLIDGPNKHEWEDWNAYNVSVSQMGWGDRVAAELTYDRQQYYRGGEALLGGNPALNIDVTKTFQDGTSNPNFGRPLVMAGTGGGDSYESDRKYYRASLFAEGRASDLFENEFLVKLLGRHRLSGVMSREDYFVETRSWNETAFDAGWRNYWTRSPGNNTSFRERPPMAAIYLDGSLANASSAVGANISPILANVSYRDGSVYAFDSTWVNHGVNYDDPYTVPSSGLLSQMLNPEFALTQASNPANYVGWNSNQSVNLLRYNKGENQGLTTAAQLTQRITTSYAGTYQGFFFDDAIVATLGWRYDEIQGRGYTAGAVAANGSMLNLAPGVYKLPDEYPDSQDIRDHSTAGSVVLHVNKLFGDKDPLPINVSFSHNRSSNFQVTNTRRDVYGNVIGNPSGETIENGILLSTKNGRYSFRAMQYKTKIADAWVSNDSGFAGALTWGLRFRNVFLYKLSNYPWSSREQPAERNIWTPAWLDANGRPVATYDAVDIPSSAVKLQTEEEALAHRDEVIRSWNEIQGWLSERGYFDAWGYTPTTQSALTDRATYEAAKASPDALDPASQYLPDPSSVSAYNAVAPQGYTLTGDTESEGYEFEFTANPTDNWRISINASSTEAVRQNVGGEKFEELVNYLDVKMAGYAGDMRRWNGNYVANNEVRTDYNNWRSNYALLKLMEGQPVPEIRKWRYNIVTNYGFSEGALKGFGVGAAYRWQDKVIIGFPVVAGSDGKSTYDLDRPYYGPSEGSVDVWLTYQRALTSKIDWKIQLSGRNVGQGNGVIPISVQPDGQTWGSVRVKPVQEWFVTNSFTF